MVRTRIAGSRSGVVSVGREAEKPKAALGAGS